MRHIVKSSDGIQFVVESADKRSVIADLLYAVSLPASALEAHGDFSRVHDVDLAALLRPAFPGAPVARPRPQLHLIQGGKP